MNEPTSLLEELSQETISESVIYDALPESLREITRIISLHSVLKLIEEYGGMSIRIPTGHKNSVLAKCIGNECAEKLVTIYSGDRIAIPRGTKLLRLIRDRKIIRARSQGIPVHELSKQFGLTERAIYIIQEMHRSEAEEIPT